MSAITVEDFPTFRISLRQSSQGRRELNRLAVPSGGEGAKKADGAVETLAHGASAGKKTGETTVRSHVHFHASSFLWSIDPIASGFQYAPPELALAGVMVSAKLQTIRCPEMALLEASVFKFLAASG